MVNKLALIGFKWDKKSTFLQGAAMGPGRIRETLHNGSANYWTEIGINPITAGKMEDMGDKDIEQYFDIEKHIALLLNQGYSTLSLGGDHSITFPIIKAYHQFYGAFDILQIDAHGDLYHEYEGDLHSHACPFARIMENQLADKLTQVGIRTLNDHQREQLKKFNIDCIEMKDFEQGKRPVFDKPIYISLDLDGLDPAYAPGVSHHEPGGLTSREVIRLIQSIKVPVIGADIVELNPVRDVQGITAALAAKLLKEIAGKMLT